MNSGRNIEQPSSFGVADIYFVIFRHKWKIAILTLLGLAAAVYYYFTHKPPYQSDATILIRYVEDTRPIKPTDNNAQVTSFDQGANIMTAEMKILTSFDLFEEVATNIGPGRILAKMGGGNDPVAAASAIAKGFKVDSDASVIELTYRNPDPTIVRPVLMAIVDAYLERHDEVHQALDVSDDTLMEQTATLRQQIAQTDEELRQAKANAGIIDVADSEKTYAQEISLIRQKLYEAEAQLSERQATLKALTLSQKGTTNVAAAANQPVPPDELNKYKAACAHLGYWQNKQNDYLYKFGYTEENKLVKEANGQIAAAVKTKSDLEAKYPTLATMNVSAPAVSDNAAAAAATDSMDLISLPIRIQTLKNQLAQIQAQAEKLGEAETKIADLNRKRQIQEDNYKYYASFLENQRINQGLGPGKNSNIARIQTPTPPFRNFKKFYRTLFGMVFGGLVAGLGLAFLIEFYLDRSIKRPIEIQTKLKIPFFLSIPDLSRNGGRRLSSASRKQLAYKNGSGNGEGKPSTLEVMSWEVNRRFNSYYDALRDRLVVYFESINLTRKPKLVAVTSTHQGAGVSTIAAGLAASLSETGDGRVLLVDMNLENGAAQQFFHGKPNCKLDDALESETRDGALVQENLYVVTEDIVTDKLPRALPKRFASLIPKLKASDYDYIIFDMPPVSPTSVTARLAGFMDNVMLVIESEKTDQQVVQQANALLAQSKANVTAVLNKTRHYIPSRLHQDFLSGV